MLICVKNNLFYSFHNDNSCIKPSFNRNKTLILSSILMSLDSIIFVCKCLVQCDLLRVTGFQLQEGLSVGNVQELGANQIAAFSPKAHG